MNGTTRAAAAVGIGYLLGRRRKFKTAAVMAAGLAAGNTSAGGLLMKRVGKLAGSTDVLGKVSPQLGDIGRIVQKDLLTAGKAAATAVVTNRVDSLADSIHERAERVRNPASMLTGEDEDEEEPADGDYEDRDRDRGQGRDRDRGRDEAEDYDDEAEDEDEERPAPVRRTGATRRSPVTRASGGAASATKSATRTVGGASGAARSAGTKKAGATRSASRTSGNRASGTGARSNRARG